MLLTPQEANLFFRLNHALMVFVNHRLRLVLGEHTTPEKLGPLSPQARLKLRQALIEHPDLLDSFTQDNPAHLNEDDLAIVASWRHHVGGKFYIFRELKQYTVFLSTTEPPVAYGVVALTQPFQEFVGPYLPVMVEAVLLPFKDRIIYDGLLNSYNISFGAGIRRTLNESYKAAKERLGIVTSLPVSSVPALTPRPKKTSTKKPRLCTNPKRSGGASPARMRLPFSRRRRTQSSAFD